MKTTFVQWGLVALMIGTLAGCGGGGGGGVAGEAAAPAGGGGAAAGGGGTGASQTVTPPSGVVDASTMSTTEFAALAPSGAVTGASIASPPVVTFQITDALGRGIKGLGFTSQSSTALRPGLSNLAFTIAKLVPGTNGSPSKWVSYIVTGSPSTSNTVVGDPPCKSGEYLDPSGKCRRIALSRPSTDNIGTLVDNGDGTYKYTFYRDITKVKDEVAAVAPTLTAPNNAADLGDLTYDPTKLHRLVIQVAGIARGTGVNTADGSSSGVTAVPMKTPLNIIFDWYPATGEVVGAAGDLDGRDIVSVSNCFQCHSKFTGFHSGSGAGSGVTSPSIAAAFPAQRQDTRMCVLCHTDQRRYGRTEATTDATGNAFTSSTYIVMGRTIGNFPNYIHKIHMGEMLTKTGYNFANVLFNEIGFPQDIRNCNKCHDGSANAPNKTAQGDNWKNVPSRLACGSCHDGINYATGKGLTLADHRAGLTTSTYGHVGGIQTDDSKCALCHGPTAIPVYHTPVTPPDTQSGLHVAGGGNNTNVAWVAANHNNLPEGAIKVTYDILSVSRNASKQPVMVFRMLQNGARKDFNTASPTGELWDNFIGSPSAYFAFAVPQDGITAPADFNALVGGYIKNIWNGTATGTAAGTLTGPDANGYYTLTFTGVTIPDNAVMLTGGLGFSYQVVNTPPLTQTNLPDYPVSASPINPARSIGGLLVIAPNVTKVATGYTGRRAIVENARCNKCHERLNVFTEKTVHAGQRNDGTVCAWCHNPNRSSYGWSVDSTNYIHAIHGAKKRTVNFNYYAASPTEGFWGIEFPGILKNCETCHLPGTYDFSASASASALPNRPYRTVARGVLSSTASTAYRYSPYITQDVDYGSAFSFNAGTGVTTPAASTTLVNSPIGTACFACHDTDLVRSHMEANGGSIYQPRSVALARVEQCTLCHLAGRVADIKAMHAK